MSHTSFSKKDITQSAVLKMTIIILYIGQWTILDDALKLNSIPSQAFFKVVKVPISSIVTFNIYIVLLSIW
jgi:hypothetical protein